MMPSQASTVFRPFSRGALEAVELLQLVERHQFGLFGDADRALALDVGVAAHRADAGAGLADIAAQQQQVDHHLDGLDALAVLREAHAVDDDDRFGARHRPRRRPPSRRASGRSARSSSAQSLRATKAANSSKPWVCSAMKAWSSTRGPPSASAASSASNSALQMPVMAAMSPPALT